MWQEQVVLAHLPARASVSAHALLIVGYEKFLLQAIFTRVAKFFENGRFHYHTGRMGLTD